MSRLSAGQNTEETKMSNSERAKVRRSKRAHLSKYQRAQLDKQKFGNKNVYQGQVLPKEMYISNSTATNAVNELC